MGGIGWHSVSEGRDGDRFDSRGRFLRSGGGSGYDITDWWHRHCVGHVCFGDGDGSFVRVLRSVDPQRVHCGGRVAYDYDEYDDDFEHNEFDREYNEFDKFDEFDREYDEYDEHNEYDGEYDIEFDDDDIDDNDRSIDGNGRGWRRGHFLD